MISSEFLLEEPHGRGQNVENRGHQSNCTPTPPMPSEAEPNMTTSSTTDLNHPPNPQVTVTIDRQESEQAKPTVEDAFSASLVRHHAPYIRTSEC